MKRAVSALGPWRASEESRIKKLRQYEDHRLGPAYDIREQEVILDVGKNVVLNADERVPCSIRRAECTCFSRVITPREDDLVHQDPTIRCL